MNGGTWAELQAARIEDLNELADQGEIPEAAAMRLGLTRDALERWCANHDRAVWARLMANKRDATGGLPTGRVSPYYNVAS